jgi:hypothetical protein
MDRSVMKVIMKGVSTICESPSHENVQVKVMSKIALVSDCSDIWGSNPHRSTTFSTFR